MKPVLAKILQGQENEVFGTKIIDLPYFSTAFHFHEECQLSYVIESEGKRMIGDSIESFKNDELILVGSNTPHVWHNNEQYFVENKDTSQAKSVSLFFNPNKLLGLIGQLCNTHNLANTFLLSKRGMKFKGNAKSELKKLVTQMAAAQDELLRLKFFCEILNLFTTTSEFDLLASSGYVNTYQLKDNDRMDKILKHVFDNFNKDIQLDEVSSMINMNKQAFCRYFKNRTQKTFITFVNEVRIGHACKLMAEGEDFIATRAYSCGFNSLSNFNKFFKQIKGVTPREYKKGLILV